MTGRRPHAPWRKHRELCGLLLLVCVAAAIGRCAPLDTAYFTLDQVRDVEVAHAILAGEPPATGPRIGQSDLHLGTLYYWVVALGIACFGEEAGPWTLLALSSVLGVMLWTVWIAKSAGSIGRARVGALALAFHAFAVIDARQLWNPALISLTSGVFAVGVAYWAIDRRAWGIGVAAVGAALMTQAHATTVALLPLVFACGRPPLPGRSIAAWLGIAIGVAMSARWIVHDVGVWLGAGDAFAYYAPTSGDTAPFLLAFVRALGFEVYLTSRVIVGGEPWRAAVDAASVAFAVLAAVGVIDLIARRRALGVAIAASVVAAAAIAAAPSHSTYPYYLEPVIPLRALAFGVGVAAVVRRLRGRRVVAAAVVATATVALGLPFVHWARGAFAADRSGVIGGSTLDLRAPWGSPRYADNRFPTRRAKHAVGWALAWHGYDHGALERLGRGPWWPAFVDDGGRFLRRARIETDAPVLIAHDSVPVPWPSPRQRLAVHGGTFDVIPFTSAIDHDTFDVETGGRHWRGFPWSRVPSLVWEHPRATIDFRFDGRTVEGTRVRFVVSTAFGVCVDAVSLGGRAAAPSGHWARHTVDTVAFDVDVRDRAETLTIVLDASRAARMPVFVNVYDVWR